MNAAWRVAFYLVVAAVFMQAVLGEYFYKSYLTELFIFLAWVVVGFQYVPRLKAPYIGQLYVLALLCVGYLIYSLFQGRELYWVARQAAFVLYASVAFMGYKHLMNEPGILARNSRRMFFFGAIMMAIQHFLTPVPGHPFFTAFLIFMLGTACWVVQKKRVGAKVSITMAAFLISLATNEHMTFLVVPFAILWAALFIQKPGYRFYLGTLALLSILILPFLAAGLSDANATWRYLYWLGVLEESWERGWFLVGKGFGTPYMPQSVEAFDALIEQVSGRENLEYQLMTVPPHNGILTILIYLGLFGVIAFLIPYWQAARLAMRKPSEFVDPSALVAAFAFLLLLASNQFVEVPYTATIFWLVYGGMIAYIQQCRFVRAQTGNAMMNNSRGGEPNPTVNIQAKQ